MKNNILFSFICNNVHMIWNELKRADEVSMNLNIVWGHGGFPIVMQWRGESKTTDSDIVLSKCDYEDIQHFVNSMRNHLKD